MEQLLASINIQEYITHLPYVAVFVLLAATGFGVPMPEDIIFGLYNGGELFWNDKQAGTMFDWIFDYVQVPAGATIFSILAFFMASAAYRTFRARNKEATILLISAIIVMLGRVPIGTMISQYIPIAADWIMTVPNLAAKRAILIGVSIGVIATSIKIIFGIEKAYLGGGD
ncbi:MAG: hypothetical protein H8D23_26885 [Candidatus Brocadiales bacterium]|nr:hypothetical protein [Candidatus Brocadiales bacterium]